MKKAAILATALIASSHGALAGSETGFYVGGSVGTAQIDFEGLDDSDTGYKVFGGYNFGLLPMVNIALEGSYVDLGTQRSHVDGEQASFANTALQAHIVGGLDLGPVGLFAKAGVSDWKTKFNVGPFSGSASGSDPTYGIGAKFQIDAIQIRAEYEQIKLDDADVDFYSIGAAYTF